MKEDTNTLLKKINYKEFRNDIDLLRKQIFKNLSTKDFLHLKKIEKIGKISTLLGYATAWIFPNPLSIFLIAHGRIVRAIIFHHIGHNAYDKVPGIPERYTSKKFGKSWRRFIDWFELITMDTWKLHHNVHHHAYAGEAGDADNAEVHAAFFRKMKLPYVLKYPLFFLSIIFFKTFIAPAIFMSSRNKKLISSEKWTHKTLLDMRLWVSLFFSIYLPYVLFYFIIIPLLFFPLGSTAVLFVFINLIFAEVLQSYWIVFLFGSNHHGEDIYQIDEPPKTREENYVRHVLVTSNYNCGSDYFDSLHIWLNYQIEHHLFPDIPLLKYKEIQPQVKALCKKHNVPYVQESLLKRIKKFTDFVVGKTSMQHVTKFPSMKNYFE